MSTELGECQTKGSRGRTVLLPEKLRAELQDYICFRFRLQVKDLHVIHYTDTSRALFYSQKSAVRGFSPNTLAQWFGTLYSSVGIVTHPEANFSIGYFFVGRKFRGLGVGTAAVKKLLGLFSGCWQIFHSNQNASASAFWKKVIPEATLNTFSVHSEFIDGYDCTLYKFRHE